MNTTHAMIANFIIALDVPDATIRRTSGVMLRRNAALSPAAKALLSIVSDLGSTAETINTG